MREVVPGLRDFMGAGFDRLSEVLEFSVDILRIKGDQHVALRNAAAVWNDARDFEIRPSGRIECKQGGLLGQRGGRHGMPDHEGAFFDSDFRGLIRMHRGSQQDCGGQ